MSQAHRFFAGKPCGALLTAAAAGVRAAAAFLVCMSGFPVYAYGAGGVSELTVRSHMEFLASDALNGRGSGTRDEWIAATYIAAQARRLGLHGVGDTGDFIETVLVNRVLATAPPEFTVGALQFRHGGEILVGSLAGISSEGPLRRYHAGRRIPAGAVLLLPGDAPAELPPEAANAAIILYRENPTVRARWNELAQRTLMVGAARIGGVPAPALHPAPVRIVLSDDAYASIARLPDGVEASLKVAAREELSHTWNVAAVLPGTDPGAPTVLLTAHLDHLGQRGTGPDRIYNGADDDASGTTAVLVLAEALAQGARLKRTLVFAWFGSEEDGGFGARYFVEKPVVPLSSIAANLEFEMIGRPDSSIAPHSLWLTGWERSNLGPELARHGAHLVADPHPEQNFFARSDNIALARHGVVAQTVSSFGLHADYHQPSDKIGRIDFMHMTESIRSMLEPIRWLADSDFIPAWTANGRPQ